MKSHKPKVLRTCTSCNLLEVCCVVKPRVIALAEPLARDYGIGKAKESVDILQHFSLYSYSKPSHGLIYSKSGLRAKQPSVLL